MSDKVSRLKVESPQLVSATNQLKLKAPDGKMRLSDLMKGIDYSYYYEQND